SHAHARGVIHRDLKPGNVLFGLDGTTPKLSDFGIAQALAQTLTDVGSSFSGTPAYLAPEQLIGDARDLGPWSDFYSLAAMAYELATGRLPFAANSMMAMIQAHIYQPAPRLESAEYPAMFSDWIARLLEKSPARRYATAADAAWALLRCPGGDDADPFAGPVTVRFEGATAVESDGESATMRSYDPIPMDQVVDKASVAPEDPAPRAPTSPDLVDTEPESRETLEGSLHLSALSGVIELSHVSHSVAAFGDSPPIPPSWRQPANPPHAQLMGAGLGLYGLRGLGMVGREEERDALWSVFQGVHDTGLPRVAVIRGKPGIGASRLAQWLAVRAYEVGGAWILRARHE